ncbi:hypothetical protein Ssi03_19700 [Sphaerisporangium siamense]|uniref:Uncharacterized protein n=1 Tax=Sphaerisporangium siamense TaxID=795645 RepID=A0A7W7GD30_9ACTN|nr:hypothetical protein [Sphaerisporangium siamense]MBB4705172.1 hypothetical protein [Sphaerisporangium siamense]GII83980.1 hypothetical protein Ssi03_19700 [Sphaerisporangium siamense]
MTGTETHHRDPSGRAQPSDRPCGSARSDSPQRSGRPARTRRPSTGRHRHGLAATVPDRREWDTAQKASAAQLDLLEPGWLVLYGSYYRRFYAIACVNTVAERLVEASDPDELRALMRQAEARPHRKSQARTSQALASRMRTGQRPAGQVRAIGDPAAGRPVAAHGIGGPVTSVGGWWQA